MVLINLTAQTGAIVGPWISVSFLNRSRALMGLVQTLSGTSATWQLEIRNDPDEAEQTLSGPTSASGAATLAVPYQQIRVNVTAAVAANLRITLG